MHIKIVDICYFFIGMAIVLSPFNGLGVQHYFGEMSVEGYFYPMLLGLVGFTLLVLKRQRLELPKTKCFYLLGMFFVIINFSVIFNIREIMDAIVKNRTGSSKAILQIILMFIGMSFSIFVYNIIDRKGEALYFFRRMIMVSFIIAGIYSLLEICALYGGDNAAHILSYLDSCFRMSENRGTVSYGRLQSVSGEPSWFGNYLAVVMPWIFSYILTETSKKKYIFVNIYLGLLVILTMSRTGYVIYALEIVILAILFRKEIIYANKEIIILFFCLSFICGIGSVGEELEQGFFANKLEVFTSLTQERGNLSNIGRFGSAATAINIFKEFPVLGIGIGQYGFHMKSFVPEWAWISHEIRNWADPNYGAWAPVHNIYARILCEVGIVGFILWVGFWAYLIYRLSVIKSINEEENIFIKILIVSTIGVLLSGFNVDTFRSFGYWFLSGVAFRVITNARKCTVLENNK